MSVIFVYVTVPSVAEAEKIAAAVVGEKLAACANILPGLRAFYRWQGRVETAGETALVFKTRAAAFDALEARVKAMHSYDVPCIVAWPCTAGHAPYLAWVGAETE
jgi:periplasmic divalent cation tolerance protein